MLIAYVKSLQDRLFEDEDIYHAITTNTRQDLLVVLQDLSLVDKLDEILKPVAKTCVQARYLNISLEQTYVDDKDEIATIKKAYEYARDHGLSFNLVLNNRYAKFNEFVVAKGKADAFLDKLNNFEVNFDGTNRKLSVLEKYFVIYNYVANRYYNQNPNFFADSMRSWMGVLSGKYAICSGFASTLQYLCDRAFEPHELYCMQQTSFVYEKNNEDSIGGHSNNIVYLNDPLYNLKGFSYNDCCWDCKDKGKPATFNFALTQFDNIFKIPGYEFDFRENIFYDNSKNKNDCTSLMLLFNTKELLEFYISKLYSYVDKNIDTKSKNFSIKKYIKKHLKTLKNNQPQKQEIIRCIKAIKMLQDPFWYKTDDLREIVQKELMPEVPVDALYNALRAVALFNGVTNEDQINQYITQQSKQRFNCFVFDGDETKQKLQGVNTFGAERDLE